MLNICFQNRCYTLPLVNGRWWGFVSVDEHWREHIAAGSLTQGIELAYHVPFEYIDDFYRFGFISLEERPGGYVVDENKPPLLHLEAAIIHSRYDAESEQAVAIGNLPCFPQLHDLTGQNLSPSILAQSTLFFPSFGALAVLENIAIGNTGDNVLALNMSGNTQDSRGCLVFDLAETHLPFDLFFRIDGYADSFTGWDIAQRAAEIRACFAALYDETQYEAGAVFINNRQYSGMQISFRHKPLHKGWSKIIEQASY